MTPIGASWAGAENHAGHTVTKIEEWPARLEGATVYFQDGQVALIRGGTWTVGRVRCDCGVEWNAGFWPDEDVRLPQPLIGPGIE